MSTSMWVAVAVVAVLGLVATLVEGRSRPRRQAGSKGPGRPSTGRAARGSGPRRGEIWWAEVPFEDGPGSKDRPCLVISVRARSAQVAKITSQHHQERPGVIALPAGAVDDAEQRKSYLETDELRRVPLSAFRRRAGGLDAQVMKSLNLS